MSLRGPIKKLEKLETELRDHSASPVVSMLPAIHQNELASILQELQTTARQGNQAIDSNATEEPQSFAKVGKRIEKGTKMSVWLKRMVSSYNLRGG